MTGNYPDGSSQGQNVTEQRLSQVWRRCVGADTFDKRPSFRIDGGFCLKQMPWTQLLGGGEIGHKIVGRWIGKPANRYQQLKKRDPKALEQFRDMVGDPELLAMIQSGSEDTIELAFELIALGEPYDRQLSSFSSQSYFRYNRDVEEAGANALVHYLSYGAKEGRVFEATVEVVPESGQREFDAKKPSLLLLQHELSLTGSPVVGLDLARRACNEYNVFVCCLRGGELKDKFTETCVRVIETEGPETNLTAYLKSIDITFDVAIANSVESIAFVPTLVSEKIPFAIYIHEYCEYTLPREKCVLAGIFADLLVYSSDQLRQSWMPVLQEHKVDLEKSTLVVPQGDMIFAPAELSAYQKARERVSTLLGIDLSGKKLVYGAGHAHWRKGTDLFTIASGLCRKRNADTIFVWIGNGINPDDYQFGIWAVGHLNYGANNPARNHTFFLPAGDYYHDLCLASDVMFLSSRRDPLPNVVFDAAKSGCHIVAFEGATGFDDDNYSNLPYLEFADYCDVDQAANLIIDAPVKIDGSNTYTASSDQVGESIDPYRQIVEKLQTAIVAEEQVRSVDSAYDIALLNHDEWTDNALRLRTHDRARRHGRLYTWDSVDQITGLLSSSGNFQASHINFGEVICDNASIQPPKFNQRNPFTLEGQDFNADFAYSIYIDLITWEVGELEMIFDNKQLIDSARSIIITVYNQSQHHIFHNRFGDRMGKTIVRVRPQQEGLLFDFLRTASAAPADEAWLHLQIGTLPGLLPHQEQTRRDQIAVLSATNKGKFVTGRLISHPDIGMVCGPEPLFLGWNNTQHLVDNIRDSVIRKTVPATPFIYPSNNAFWVKQAVVQKMFEAFGDEYPWPPYDFARTGTIFHLIEKLWPCVVASLDQQSVFINREEVGD